MYIRPEMHWWPSVNDSSCHLTVVHTGLLINVHWTKKASECCGNPKAHPSEPELDTPSGELHTRGGALKRKTADPRVHHPLPALGPGRDPLWSTRMESGKQEAQEDWGGESGSSVWMRVSSLSLKKIIIKFVAWGKAEVETSKQTRKLPVGTSGFRNQIQSWLWLVTECANWPVLSPTVHPLSHWPECRCGVNRFLSQPRGLFFGSVCKQATGIFHRSPGISFKAA